MYDTNFYKIHTVSFKRLLRANFLLVYEHKTDVGRLPDAPRGKLCKAIFSIVFKTEATRDRVYQNSYLSSRAFRQRERRSGRNGLFDTRMHCSKPNPVHNRRQFDTQQSIRVCDKNLFAAIQGQDDETDEAKTDTYGSGRKVWWCPENHYDVLQCEHNGAKFRPAVKASDDSFTFLDGVEVERDNDANFNFSCVLPVDKNDFAPRAQPHKDYIRVGPQNVRGYTRTALEILSYAAKKC